MIIGEWYKEIPNNLPKGYYGYWVKLNRNHTTYYKDGTTTNPSQRFKAADYKSYSTVKHIYLVRFDNEYEMMNFEELNKSWIRQQIADKKIKGVRWIKNDRFTTNHKLTQLPISYRYGETKFLEI